MPAKKRLSETEAGINNKSQGSVATRVRCGGYFTTNLLPSLLVDFFK